MELLQFFNNLDFTHKIVIVFSLLVITLFLFRYIAILIEFCFAKYKDSKGFNSQSWLSLIIKNKCIYHACFALCVLILPTFIALLLDETHNMFVRIFIRLIKSYAIITIMLLLSSILDLIGDKFYRSIKFPVKGITQAIKIFLWAITIILILATIANKSPIYFIGSLTALSAVTLLIFKDSILGLVSGFQLVLNDLVRIGDWVEIPSQNADGEVVEILLTTVRVKNWNNTIVNIPAYNLVSGSFINWRAMTEAGARRIKRAINIDVKTIHFLSDDEIKTLSKLNLLKDYLVKKQEQFAKENKDKDEYNRHRLSNIGTFRRYCYEYLKENPHIAQNFTLIVRQLDPTSEGVPLEIYAFCNDTVWANYENIQSDIFDHLLSIIPIFNLRVYQRFGDK